MNSGLYALPGVSATVWAAARGRRLELADTKASKVNLGSRRAAWDSLDSDEAVRTATAGEVAWASASDGGSIGAARFPGSATTSSTAIGWPTTVVSVSSTSWRYRSLTRLRCKGLGASSTNLSPAKSTGRRDRSVNAHTFSDTCSRSDSAHCAQRSSTSPTQSSTGSCPVYQQLFPQRPPTLGCRGGNEHTPLWGPVRKDRRGSARGARDGRRGRGGPRAGRVARPRVVWLERLGRRGGCGEAVVRPDA